MYDRRHEVCFVGSTLQTSKTPHKPVVGSPNSHPTIHLTMAAVEINVADLARVVRSLAADLEARAAAYSRTSNDTNLFTEDCNAVQERAYQLWQNSVIDEKEWKRVRKQLKKYVLKRHVCVRSELIFCRLRAKVFQAVAAATEAEFRAIPSPPSPSEAGLVPRAVAKAKRGLDKISSGEPTAAVVGQTPETVALYGMLKFGFDTLARAANALQLAVTRANL